MFTGAAVLVGSFTSLTNFCFLLFLYSCCHILLFNSGVVWIVYKNMKYIFAYFFNFSITKMNVYCNNGNLHSI